MTCRDFVRSESVGEGRPPQPVGQGVRGSIAHQGLNGQQFAYRSLYALRARLRQQLAILRVGEGLVERERVGLGQDARITRERLRPRAYRVGEALGQIGRLEYGW
jgi:hypothetical protein